MKKMLLIAVAAMVSLSSCVNTNEVYTGPVQEMGFKSAVTRSLIKSTTDLVGSISVTATWDDPSSTKFVPYFENHEFVYDGGLWNGNPAKYWPTTGDMQFLAVHPYPVTARVTPNYKVDGTFENLTFGTIDNNILNQHDILYSDLLEVSAPQTSAQSLLFHHAYAQLNVNFKKTNSAAEVVVKSVAVEDICLNGILTVTPASGAASTATWQTGLPVDRYFLDEDATGIEDNALDVALQADAAFAPNAMVVIPGVQTKIVIVYTIDGVQHTYKHTLSGNWDMGSKYTYNYTINVNEIIFDCDVEDWVIVDGGSVTI